MVEPALLAQKFSAGLEYAPYVATGTPEQQRRWADFLALASVTEAQRTLIASFVRPMRVLVISGVWCGDCVQQVPLIHRIAEANPQRLAVRYIDRDVHKDLSAHLTINGGGRVPVVLFLSEDSEFCALAGDRTLARYRTMAERQLGPACPTGLVAPEQSEVAATMADWVDEFERVHLMLRLSPRLRQKYND